MPRGAGAGGGGYLPGPGGGGVPWPGERGVPWWGERGYPGWGVPCQGVTQVGYPPPRPGQEGGGTQLGQQKEYSLNGGRYASCVHAGGLFVLKKLFYFFVCVHHTFQSKLLTSFSSTLVGSPRSSTVFVG